MNTLLKALKEFDESLNTVCPRVNIAIEGFKAERAKNKTENTEKAEKVNNEEAVTMESEVIDEVVIEAIAEDEKPVMVNPIVVEEPTGKVKVDFSKMGQSNATMKPVKSEENPFKGEAFDKLPVLERIKVVLESSGIACSIEPDQSGLFRVNMFIKDAYFGSIYVDRDGCLYNNIPKIILSLCKPEDDITKLENAPMLALFNSNWPNILIDFTDGKTVSACDCITSQERELNELFDLATIPVKIRDSQRAKTLKNLESIKMEGVLNDILMTEKKTRFRFENFKDSGTFDLVSDDKTKETLLSPYSAKKPYKVIVDLTKGGNDRFNKVAL